MREVPVVIAIDVEPDPRDVDPCARSPWRGAEAWFDFVRRLRPALEQASGAPVHFSWFLRLDPQVAHAYGSATWPMERYHDKLAELVAAGDELGCHPHAFRWDEAFGGWVVDHGDPGWVEHCVASSLAAYEEAMGRPCQSFRFGDSWMSNATMRQLDALGIRFDLTLESGTRAGPRRRRGEKVIGSLLDLTCAPRQPFRPRIDDFTVPDPARRDGIWIIPVTADPDVPPLRTLVQQQRYRDTVRRLVSTMRGRPPEQVRLRLNTPLSPAAFTAKAHKALDRSDARHLAITLRASVGRNRAKLDAMQHKLEALCASGPGRRFVFSTPAETLARLRLT